jgi:membrane-bound lytic murein transglycosylase D
MPNETRNYVPKLQAVKNIVANPDQFRRELPLIAQPPLLPDRHAHARHGRGTAARLADVQLDDFKALNPQLKPAVILAAGTPQILLPWDNATVFKRNFEAYDQGKFATWTPGARHHHDGQRSGPARRHERSRTAPVNSIPPRMLIKAGSVLIVPRKGNTEAT